ncbi:MAG: SDR family oxidoreductase [Myxococcales bacterium]|nr:SDR family oxidoreductase [Myxococcales bacterium]
MIAVVTGATESPRHAAYAASKWGQVGFIKSLAEELRGSGLTAMSVLPGSVDTDMLVGSGFEPAMTPDDVARTAAFVALDAPDAMNASATEIFGP